MRRFDTVFPACGSANSAIELTPAELHEYSRSGEWIGVCRAAWEVL
jgi:prolyl-tRNA editing enzyme YbaK/EbsC (Cys-tRNA(Pro) deacylase)